jgi:transposase InsO family protein
MSNKTALAKSIGVARSTLYYKSKMKEKDWRLKQKIEDVLREFPSYGHRRTALHLKINKKRVRRVMRLYGIKPYRRKIQKPFKKAKKKDVSFPNLLLENTPHSPDHIWASDFTHVWYGKWVYVATIIDLYSRKVVGVSVRTDHSGSLIISALLNALHNHTPPKILHSDHGSEYIAGDYRRICQNLGIEQSMSAKGCPWENGYQESFYDKFKIDLGDPQRFRSLGELVYHIYQTIYVYNTKRIHTSLGMSPNEFLINHERKKHLEAVS